MDLDRFIGANVEDLSGRLIGEVAGLEILGAKITVILATEEDFSDPDGDGEPVPVPEPLVQEIEAEHSGENVVSMAKRGMESA
jgi:hypothetical protein